MPRLFAVMLLFTAVVATACAQDSHASDTPAPARAAPGTVHVLRLQNTPTQAEQNEVLTALRNILTPVTRIFLVPSDSTIVLRGSEEDFTDAQKLLADLDRPRKLYRLNFAVKDSEGGRQLGEQHYFVVVAAGQRVQLKEGSRVPIVTGSMGTATPTPQTQFTYVDVGMNFDATIDEQTNGLRLRCKVERSSIAEDKDNFRRDDPVIRQNLIESTSILTLTRPVSLGAMDISGSTRRVEIEVTAELAK